MNIRFIRGARDKKINVKCCLTYCTSKYFEILRSNYSQNICYINLPASWIFAWRGNEIWRSHCLSIIPHLTIKSRLLS